ncbi:hypothetical protein BCR44DRAFT_1430664 [Catenaria anguillulae PL171]|uniref:Uncharacterized protein n=1 Tax=Catenaria anguillulae PL171 TaxID=765915 RepID=A0A1Y2HRH1_9FUNG|nr:hypothetical protein BCR44DRAFT_1430664 [Catenaria anguillulae PL171]
MPPNLSALVGLMSLLPASSHSQSQSHHHQRTNDVSSISRETTATSSLAAAAASPDDQTLIPVVQSMPAAAAPRGDLDVEASHWNRLFGRLDAFETRVVNSFSAVNERIGALEARMARLELHVSHSSDPPSPRIPHDAFK